MEMDLVMAKAEIMTLQKIVREQADMLANNRTHIASLQSIIEKQRQHKCNFGNVCIKPDGINELDACVYETLEKHMNVTVEVIRCKNCGHVEVLWKRQENTEDGDSDG